jgi:redox-sensitive bicupin YhaK (pirin superfamily)
VSQTVTVHDAQPLHWVGDGFPVHSVFSYSDHNRNLSPFLLLDHARPMDFAPAAQPRGVGVHPHRGFETVTIVYAGEVAHRDSTGHGGVIGVGDVQWMTAGAGILHEEFHSAAFTRSGGAMHMAQLWVNLPARVKLAPPRYQAITAASIPPVPLASSSGTVRVIAGSLFGTTGPAQTHSPLTVADLQLPAGTELTLPKPAGWTGALVVLLGEISVAAGLRATQSQLVSSDPAGTGLQLRAAQDSLVLVLQGEPLREPVVGYGPFVMNTRAEIAQAIDDYNQGRFGAIH